jgi:hypothetical protein
MSDLRHGVKEDIRVIVWIHLIKRLSEMDKRSHEFKLAKLGPRFPAERGISGHLPYTSLLASVDDHLGSGST